MKRKLRNVCLCAALASLVGAAALAAGSTSPRLPAPNPVVLSDSAPALQVRSFTVGETMDPVYSYLCANFSGDELYHQLSDYALFKVTSRPTAQELDILVQVLQQNLSLEQAMDIYRLWTTTASSSDLMVQIAQYYQPEMERMPFWTHDAYNSITGNKALNREEIQAYLDQGLTQEDILVADELSRRQVYNIDQILALKQDGRGWLEVVSLIYSALGQPLPLENPQSFASVSGSDVLSCLSLSETFDLNLAGLLEKAAAGEDYMEDARAIYSPQYDAELSKLRADGTLQMTTLEITQQAELTQYAKEKAQALQVAPETVDALVAQGADPLAAINAITKAEETGVSPQQILQEEAALQ